MSCTEQRWCEPANPQCPSCWILMLVVTCPLTDPYPLIATRRLKGDWQTHFANGRGG